MSGGANRPPLAGLVLSGSEQTEAVAITDFIFMAQDISNAYLVTTDDGDVLVNTGFNANAERTKRLLAPARKGALRYIVVTQSHPDHFGGVPTLREANTEIITECRFTDTRRYYQELFPYAGRRSGKLWSTTIRHDGPPKPPEEVYPDITVDRHFAFDLGGRRFELISTPGGETVDGLTVWMPQERVAFTGNLFGPVFMSMPFLCTLRGDKPRSVDRYLRSLDRVRALGAHLLVTGHGEPIRGAEKIRTDLDKLYAAVELVREATVAGMNVGKDVHTLMREIRLPEALKIGEYHGKVSWAVRSIWEEYSGWFHYDSTTELYGVPRSSVSQDLVELAGGPDKMTARARAKLSAGKPLEAMHLLDIALGADPAHSESLLVKKDALQRLLDESGGTNFSETMWLKSELVRTETLLTPKA